MSNNYFIHLLVFISIFVSVNCFSQELRFSHLGIKNGLSDNYVEDVIQDSYGNLWIATAHGLNKFDGKQISIYNTIGNDMLSLDNINNLFISSDDTLWICSRMNGFVKYNLKNNSFSTFAFQDSIKENANYKNSIKQPIESFNSDIWAVTMYGVIKYNQKNKIWEWYTKSLDSLSLSKEFAFCITESKDSTLYVGFLNYGHVFYYDRKNDGFKKFTDTNGTYPNINSVTSILKDSNGKLWYGSLNDGLVNYDFNTSSWTHFKMNLSSDSLKSNHITYIFEDSNKRIWVATINGGLSLYDSHSKSFKTYLHSDINQNSISSNSISSIYEDIDGNIIISTDNGLSIVDWEKNKINIFNNTGASNHSLRNTSCIYNETIDNIWIGTDGNGLFLYNSTKNSFKRYTTNDGLLSNAILDIEPNGDGKLWIATWNGGISLFDPKINTFENFITNNSEINNNNVKAVFKDGDFLWIGTHGEGINIYDCKKNIFYNKNNPSPLFNFDLGKPIWINDIYKDLNNNYWILTTVGLYRIYNNKMFEYYPSKSKENTISGYNIKCVFEDKNGNLYVGSNGLDVYDSKNDCFIRLKNKNKDLPKEVNGMVESKDGNLWLSSNNGLYCYNRSANTVYKYTENDGFQGNKFIERSISISNNTVYVGGINGFNSFNPQDIIISKQVPRVHIQSCKTTSLSLNNTNDVQSIEYIHNKNIEIPYSGSQILSFEFIAATLQNPELIRYSVQLIGFENIERQLGEQTSVTYTNLSPGKYTLKVRASNSRGLEQSNISELEFEIRTPWYLSWIFRLCVFVVLAGLILFAIKYRTRLIEQRNQQLSDMVEYRTQQLREQKSLVEFKNKELNETIQSRDKLMSIISHDLRNPLHTLSLSVEMLINNIEKISLSKQKEILEIIKRSADSMYTQSISLLEWTINQEGKLQCIPENVNLHILLTDVITFYKQSIDSKNIELNYTLKNTHYAWCDGKMIGAVLRNIIGNGIKFTPINGKISINLITKPDTILLQIADNGVGIDSDRLHLLQKKNELHSTFGTGGEKGVGLGLKLVFDFIEKNNGTITFDSKPNEGTSVSIHIPAGNKLINYGNDELFETPVQLIEEHNTTKKKILIVDDNTDVLKILHDLFFDDYHICQAQNGEDAFSIACIEIPDIIITDVDMPIMDGKELCHKIKKQKLSSHIPIIIVSALGSNFEQIEGLSLGIDDYIVKPFDSNILKIKVNSLIKKREEYANYLRKKILSEPVGLNPESDEERFIRKVIEIIDNNLSSGELNVDLIANTIGYSRAQLYRKILVSFNQSPIELIKEFRLKKAVQMLDEKRYRISDVAYETGFNSPRYFSTCFFEKFKMTPSEYMKRKES